VTPEQLKAFLWQVVPWIVLVASVVALAAYGLVSLLR
jgi:hypothetical protein